MPMPRRRLLAVLALAAGALPWSAAAHLPPPALVSVEVVDRTDGAVLPVHTKDGRRYVVGTPGHEYALRVRNLGARRVLAVTSVDGVNVVSGETASPDQSGYVIERYATVEITGWRKSLERAAAFYFTDLGDSYAARTGRPLDVGVIGVAVFPEKVAVASGNRIATFAGAGETRERAEAAADAPAAGAPAESSGTLQKRSDEAARAPAAPMPRIGTGHGRDERSVVQLVRFDRESSTPAQTLVVQYDRRENLVALGVLPSPTIAARDPNPFPGLRFAPDPPR